MQAVQTAATPCTQTPGNNPSQWLHNWACTWNTPNKGAQHAGHVVGGAVHSSGGGVAAIILVLAVIAVLAWMVSTKRKPATG
jgi:hypothetical protein